MSVPNRPESEYNAALKMWGGKWGGRPERGGGGPPRGAGGGGWGGKGGGRGRG